MERLRQIYIALLIIVGILLILTTRTVMRPLSSEKQPSIVGLQGLIKLEDRTIVKFRITNHEAGDVNYFYRIFIDEVRVHQTNLWLEPGSSIEFTQIVYPGGSGGRELNILVYKPYSDSWLRLDEGNSDLVDNATFYIYP